MSQQDNNNNVMITDRDFFKQYKHSLLETRGDGLNGGKW